MITTLPSLVSLQHGDMHNYAVKLGICGSTQGSLTVLQLYDLQGPQIMPGNLDNLGICRKL